MIKNYGPTTIFMLLDYTEAHARIASRKTLNVIFYSFCKHHYNMKWLVGHDPVGTFWEESISVSYPNSMSNEFCTMVTSKLDQIHFGCVAEGR